MIRGILIAASVRASPVPVFDAELELERAIHREVVLGDPLGAIDGYRAILARRDASNEVPRLRGILVDAKPACRPTQLLVALPLPGASTPPEPEISLKLDAPLAGKPELEAEFQWEGVPSAFTQSPFLLTMDTERAKIEGLKTTPCAAPARKRSEPR